MNQKGFIPIIFIVVGAVVIASATFGVVKYKDELSQLPAAVINFLIGPDEEQDIVEEPVIEEEPEEEILDKKTEKAIEKEEKEEEKQSKRIVKGPKTGPKEEKPEEQIEEIQEQQEQEVEVIEADVLTISDINIDINKVPTDPVVITWITNKESDTSLEYGLRPGFYDWLIYNNVSKEIDAGFLHAIYLYVEFNRVHHFQVSSTDSDGNTAESENMSFRKIYYPFNIVCHSPKLPVVTSHIDGQTIGEGDDGDGAMPGIQIELKGNASAKGIVFISVSSLWYEAPIGEYKVPVGENGRWEQEDITLEDGKNTLYIKVRDILNCESDIIFVLFVDSEAPTATIWITNHDGNNFTLEWLSSDYPDCNCTFDIRYKVKLIGEKNFKEITDGWQTDTTEHSRTFTDAENGTHKFNVRATDPAGNTGEWLEEDIEIVI